MGAPVGRPELPECVRRLFPDIVEARSREATWYTWRLRVETSEVIDRYGPVNNTLYFGTQVGAMGWSLGYSGFYPTIEEAIAEYAAWQLTNKWASDEQEGDTR